MHEMNQNVYFWYGLDANLMQTKLDHLKQKLTQHHRSLNCQVFYLDDMTDFQPVTDAWLNHNLFASHNFLLVRNCELLFGKKVMATRKKLAGKDQQQLARALFQQLLFCVTQKSENSTLVLMANCEHITKNRRTTAIYQQISELKAIQPWSEQQTIQYILQVANQHHCHIDKVAATILYQLVPHQTFLIEQEIKKMAQVATLISKDVVLKYNSYTLASAMFWFHNAFLDQNMSAFLRWFYFLKKQNDHFMRFFTLATNSLMLIKKIKYLQGKHTSYYQMQKLMKINSYRLKILIQKSDNFSRLKLDQLLIMLSKIYTELRQNSNYFDVHFDFDMLRLITVNFKFKNKYDR